MLSRIFLVIAILAGLAIGVFNLVTVKSKVVAVQTDLRDTKNTLASTQQELGKTKSTLAKTEADLNHTKKELADAKTEAEQAVAKADAADKRAQKATDDLAAAQQKLNDTQADLAAYQNSGLTAEQAFNAAKTIKQIENTVAGLKEENKVLGQTVQRQAAKIAIYEHPDYHVTLPASLHGQVVVYDPKYEFVVLNIGADQGVLDNGELLVSHEGKLVAKVVVRSVQKDRCIANVVPGWKLDDVLEGDAVIPAYPAQS